MESTVFTAALVILAFKFYKNVNLKQHQILPKKFGYPHPYLIARGNDSVPYQRYDRCQIFCERFCLETHSGQSGVVTGLQGNCSASEGYKGLGRQAEGSGGGQAEGRARESRVEGEKKKRENTYIL